MAGSGSNNPQALLARAREHAQTAANSTGSAHGPTASPQRPADFLESKKPTDPRRSQCSRCVFANSNNSPIPTILRFQQFSDSNNPPIPTILRFQEDDPLSTQPALSVTIPTRNSSDVASTAVITLSYMPAQDPITMDREPFNGDFLALLRTKLGMELHPGPITHKGRPNSAIEANRVGSTARISRSP